MKLTIQEKKLLHELLPTMEGEVSIWHEANILRRSEKLKQRPNPHLTEEDVLGKNERKKEKDV